MINNIILQPRDTNKLLFSKLNNNNTYIKDKTNSNHFNIYYFFTYMFHILYILYSLFGINCCKHYNNELYTMYRMQTIKDTTRHLELHQLEKLINNMTENTYEILSVGVSITNKKYHSAMVLIRGGFLLPKNYHSAFDLIRGGFYYKKTITRHLILSMGVYITKTITHHWIIE